MPALGVLVGLGLAVLAGGRLDNMMAVRLRWLPLLVASAVALIVLNGELSAGAIPDGLRLWLVLPAYLILTSGAQHGVCDDKNPVKHQISGGNLYQQVADAGLQYRQYAESMPNPCMDTNTSDNRYLVRHAPVPYYVSEKQRCQQWDVPLGTSTSGALHDAVKSGSLPAFSFVTPDACNDMHGEPVCGLSKNQLISTGDSWAGNWVDQITAGPDFKSGKLTIVLTWDEGSRSSNHLPVVVISPKTSHVSSSTAYSHCSTLRTMEDLLALKPLNCAATATSMVSEFHLG